ncbi:MAG: DUF4465 domain-containing protein [Brumimicrobium sp.]
MKKFYFLAGALFTALTIQAQIIVDFEELNLQEETSYNGSDGEGGFTSNNVFFKTNYNTEWSFMESGFAYSNQTDTQTPGFTNEFSVITGSGAENSENFAVNYSGGYFEFAQEVSLQNVQITNTTYSFLSMRDGDAIGKVFGSSTNASGDDDGTEGKDYFFITFSGFDADSNAVSSLDFYLADFRSNDASEHYILDEWTNVDLSAFTGVKYVTFSYTSSDVGGYGINTPTYFALDNLVYSDDVSSIAKNDAEKVSVFPNPANNVLNIQGITGDFVLYSITGEQVMEFEVNQAKTIDVSMLNSGIYLLKGENVTRKVVVQ